MNTRVEIFDANTIDDLQWPENESAQRAKKYLIPFVKHGPRFYIDNADVRMVVLTLDATVIPLVISEEKSINSDVCSPYSHFVNYTLDEINKGKWGHGRSLLKALVLGSAFVFRATYLDRSVYVNNWLLSTNPCPELSAGQIGEITSHLTKRFADHAIIFPSVNPRTHENFFDALRERQYKMVPARTVYLFDASQESSRMHENLKRDRKLLRDSPYAVIGACELTNDDIRRMTKLYRDLYLKKHTPLNLQFNENFISLIIKENIFTVRALKKNGRIDAFVSFYVNGEVMTGSLIGYDMDLPSHLGLYRQAFAILMTEASNHGKLLNMSGGAGLFKILRGGVPQVEYQAVYDRDLPYYRRLGWDCVRAGGIFQHAKVWKWASKERRRKEERMRL